MSFSYDTRTKCIMINDKHCVYHVDGTHVFYYKENGQIVKLTDEEIVDLKRSAKWFITNRDADFGSELNEFFLT